MKLTRAKRISLEIIGPPILGASLWVLSTMAGEIWARGGEACSWENLVGMIGLLAMTTVYACVFAGIPSLLYAVIMEWRFARGFDPSSWWSVGLSTLLGSASGCLIVLFFGWPRLMAPSMWILFGGIGTAVGFVLGLLIKVLSPKPTTEGSP